MVEKIDNLDNFTLVSNHILIIPSPNHGFMEVNTESGTTVKLFTSAAPEHEAKNFSISGTVLKTPERLNFDGDLRLEQNGITISRDEFSSRMRNSLPFDTDLNVIPGDQVIYNYGNHIDAVEERRVFDVEGHGYCLLVSYDTLFAKKNGEELVPLNGWIIFKRDVIEAVNKRESGIYTVDLTVNEYTSPYGTVVIADKPVRAYMDKGHDGKVQLNPGDRIVIQKGFGYRIAYDIVAGDLKDLEVVRYKNVVGIIN